MSLLTAKRRLTRGVLRKNLIGYAFVAPWLLGLLVFQGYPIVGSIYYSFTRYNILQPPRWVGLANYHTLFTIEPLLGKAVGNTLYMVATTIPLGLLLSLGMALLMSQNVNGVGIYRTIYYLPLLVPPVAGTLMWLLILHPDGLMNNALGLVGLPRLGWFRDPAWSKPALVIMGLWGVGGSALIFLGGLKNIPTSLYEAAKIDGANLLKQFWLVTIPLLTPVIFFNVVMGIIGSFQSFTAAFIAGGASSSGAGRGGPLDSLLMYMMLLYRHGFGYFQMGYASAMAVSLAIVILIITIIMVRTSSLWVYYEGGAR